MLDLKITGDEDIVATIAKASQKMQKVAAFEALVVALQPLIAEMRAQAPVDEGDLVTSIGFRLRRYRGGKTLYGVVGPRSGKFGTGKQPAKTAHLIEFGHWAGKGKNRRWVNANAFMRRSWLAKRDAVLAEFNRQFGTRLFAEIQSRKRQTKHT